LIPEGLTVKQRTSMIHYAYEFMGIPYKWGGADENGFDCSGYTRHVFLNKGIELPRVSEDQYNYAKKINKKRAYMGDLVFFSEGNGISHVGILVNKVNESKKMIHSSSSKGISVVDIEASNYWSKRVVGYGRVLK
ncbi:MAG: C40 family peptidase, partial [Crocinitomicaceae bacterium]|nr:C40 family peptidase [Crocinitomicaceae bacterium]